MRRFSCFSKFLVMAFLSQGTAFLSASGRDGGVLVAVPRDVSPPRRCRSTPVLYREYPEIPFLPPLLALPDSSSSLPEIPPPAMSPTSFSQVVIGTCKDLNTTDDYVKFMRKVDPSNRKALSEILNIDGVITASQEKTTSLQGYIDRACHEVLYKNDFNWKSDVGPRRQGYLAIAEGVMKLLNTQKILAEHFNVSLNIEEFSKLLEGTLLKCQEISKEISKEEASLEELRELTGRKKVIKASGYEWNNSDF